MAPRSSPTILKSIERDTSPWSPGSTPDTWVVLGASRGIGLQFVKSILSASHTNQVLAVVRNVETASGLWQIAAGQDRPGRCLIDVCDVRMLDSIDAFIGRVRNLISGGMRIKGLIMNAGILHYPNRAMEMSFETFANHLSTNTIGPIIIAQKLLHISAPVLPSKVVFISSDSGSASKFLDFEDGFAAYAASKAALNQTLRHMALEMKRQGGIWHDVCVLAMHPGEVATDMANIDIAWNVEGVISPQESVHGMLKVIAERTSTDSGTFWTWEGKQHPW